MSDALAPDFMQCIVPGNYGYQKRRSAIRRDVVKGRPRYKLKDIWAPYEITLSWQMTDDQYLEFQQFWSETLLHGSLSFFTNVALDDMTKMVSRRVNPLSAYQSTKDRYGLWVVGMTVEIAGGFDPNEVFQCPDIYGGPITNPANDVIYGGPIDALAADIIIPCPGVDPNG